MYKNVASQKISVYAYNTTTGAPVTGDAANITAQISKDGGAAAATNDVNPTELDATDLPGTYLFDMTQAETNADLINFQAVSATGSVRIEPVTIYTFPGTSSGLSANTVLIEGSDATDQIRDAVVDDSTRIDASALNTLSGFAPASTIASATDVNDALNTDTVADLSQGAPPALPTVTGILRHLYNRQVYQATQTSSEKAFYNGSGTKIYKKTVSDDGTTLTESDAITGA